MQHENSGNSSIRDHLDAFISECLRLGIMYQDALSQVEMEFIMQALEKTGYNISQAAILLDINRNTLRKKIEYYKSFERFQAHQNFYSSR